MNRLANNGPKAMVSQAIKPDPTIRSWPPAVPSGNNGPDTAMLQLAAGKNVDIAPGVPASQPASLSAHHQPSQPVARMSKSCWDIKESVHACLLSCMCVRLPWCKAPHPKLFMPQCVAGWQQQ